MNKTIVIGRLMENPKRISDNNVVFYVTNTALKEDNEVMKHHRILTFGKQAELAMRHLHKKDLCCIEGKLAKAESGEISIAAEHITFLCKK